MARDRLAGTLRPATVERPFPSFYPVSRHSKPKANISTTTLPPTPTSTQQQQHQHQQSTSYFPLLRLPVELTNLILTFTQLSSLRNLRQTCHALNNLINPILPTRTLHLTISSGRFLLSPSDPSLRLELAHFLRKTLFTLPLSRIAVVEELRIRINDITGPVTRSKETVRSGDYDGFAGMTSLKIVRIRSANTSRIWEIGQMRKAERVMPINAPAGSQLSKRAAVGKDAVAYMPVVQALQTLIPLGVVVEVEMRVQPEDRRRFGGRGGVVLRELGKVLSGREGGGVKQEGVRREKVTVVKKVRTQEERELVYGEGRGKVGGELYIWSIWCIVDDLQGPGETMREPWKRCWEARVVRDADGMLET
ncbi:hypothetical protein BJ508DRAFT_328773 [Ascobolus immersus RN42]|uniref:F-box domain-containing protein n=1 Tax=Ascobolus immersus RN42 TaxID=1160509 RepID=A0A3N4IAV8_ASCIM|nr:hypothetical protein BJ508DRAFT_328773 [Ascobolus immersus RN42]